MHSSKMLDRVNRSMSPTSQSQAIGSFSQLGLFHNHGGPNSNAHLGLMSTSAEEVIKLKKELRLKQAEYDKEKAILLQKNEQLEAQLKETSTRQQAQVMMYEAMINSLKAPEISAPSEIIVAKIQESERLAYEGEINELKEHRKKLQDDIIDREREFARLTNEKEGYIKELQLQVDKVLMEKSQQIFQMEIERKEFQQRLQVAQTEREQAEALLDLKWQSRLGEQQMDTERLKLEQMKEIDRIKQECEAQVKEIRTLHEQEKQTLEFRLDRQSHDLKSLHHMVIQQDSATTDTKQSTQQHREQLSQELGMIQAEVDGIKQQYDKTVADLTKEKEQAEARNAKLQKQLEKLKNAPKQAAQVLIDLPMKLGTRSSDHVNEEPFDSEAYQALQRQVKNLKQEVELLQEENSKLGDQVKKLRKEHQEIQEYAERLETNEKKLRKVLEDQATIEQEQVVELRRMLNQEKKRAIEQTEVISKAKEALERENYKQATMINEKEEQIRTLNHELRSHEKRLYEIQSMFNTQPNAGQNALNMSCALTENQMLMHQKHITGQTPGGHYIAQSQANFSPRNFANGLGMNLPLKLERQGSGIINQSMQLPNLNINQSFVSAAMNPVEGGIIYNQIPNIDQNDVGKVECVHCMQAVDYCLFYDHLATEHPQVLAQQNQGLAKDSSHSQMIGLAGLNLTQASIYGAPLQYPQQYAPLYQRDNFIAQSLCLSNKSQNPYNQGNDYVSTVLCQTPQQLTNIPPNIPRPPTHHQVNMIQSSPRLGNNANKMISNSRSFTCLLKEIDENEEQNIAGSLPQNGKLGREQNQIQDLVQVTEEDRNPQYICTTEQSVEVQGLRKSRNHQSTQNLKANATQQLSKKPSNSSLNGSKKSKKGDKSVVSQNSQNKSLNKEKSSENITNEIKDLLEKLVAYQGGNQNQSTNSHHAHQLSQQMLPSHSHSVAIPSGKQTQRQTKGLLNTESMVELRSSESSSLAYLPQHNHQESQIELRAPQTARDYSGKSPMVVTQSMQIRKQWNINSTSQDRFKHPLKNGEENVHKKPQTFEIVNKPEHHQSPVGARDNESCSSYSSSCASQDRMTAKHTSKDTIMTIPGVPGSKRRGRRYHEVNKSDVMTPNSPRRYQDYFKNRLHPTESTLLPPKQLQVAPAAKPSAKPKTDNKKENNSHQHKAQKNHRYSPSNTKSIADESQYHQLSPSPEKQAPKSKLNLNQNTYIMGQATTTQDDSRLFILNSSNPYNMPLQQVQNQMFAPGKQSSNGQRVYGTYDSGSVIYGAASDAIFKTHGSGSHLGGAQHNLMFGGAGFGFQPNATLSTVKAGAQGNVHHFDGVINCSIEDDGDIRPSQIDEFIEVRTQQNQQQANIPDYGSGIGPAHITSSYITIGDDDPFITGKFCDASTKQFNFKPQSHCPSKVNSHHPSIPLSKNSDMQFYNQLIHATNLQQQQPSGKKY